MSPRLHLTEVVVAAAQPAPGPWKSEVRGLREALEGRQCLGWHASRAVGLHAQNRVRGLAQLEHAPRGQEEEAAPRIDLEAEVVVQPHLRHELALGGVPLQPQPLEDL